MTEFKLLCHNKRKIKCEDTRTNLSTKGGTEITVYLKNKAFWKKSLHFLREINSKIRKFKQLKNISSEVYNDPVVESRGCV